ncbi:MAG TPA: NAD/NADP octopine/nopaline dehydrogenase family protein [Burkholderiaceae bacterium]
MNKAVWTIIGAGMGGKGLAAELGIKGMRLRIHDIDDAQVAGIRALGGLKVEGRDASFAPIEMATTDLASAVTGADVLLVSIYGNAHAELATQLAPILVDGQTIVLIQGHFAGALVFKAALDRAGCKARVDVSEMDGYPYMLTVKSQDTVLMTTVKKHWNLAAMPASRTAAVLEKIAFAFPGLEAAKSLLENAFLGGGGIFHVGGIITNVGNVEGPQSYNFYAANMVPSVCRLLERLDAERIAAAKAFGLDALDLKTWLGKVYGYTNMTMHEALQKMAVTHYRFAPAPKSLTHRYLVQDVGCELVPITAFGKVAGIPMPASEAAIEMANSLTGRDFRAEGRNLANLGIEGMSAADIKKHVSA